MGKSTDGEGRWLEILMFVEVFISPHLLCSKTFNFFAFPWSFLILPYLDHVTLQVMTRISLLGVLASFLSYIITILLSIYLLRIFSASATRLDTMSDDSPWVGMLLLMLGGFWWNVKGLVPLCIYCEGHKFVF